MGGNVKVTTASEFTAAKETKKAKVKAAHSMDESGSREWPSFNLS